MLLVLFAIGVWSWFHYLPQHAVQTITHMSDLALNQLWYQAPVESDYQFIIPEIHTWVINTGAATMQTGSSSGSTANISGNIVTIWRTAPTSTGSTDTTLTWSASWLDVRNEIDITDQITTWSVITESNSGTIDNSIISISIGWQTVTVDGTPDEDIVINANWYTVTVQKN
jgi:hypothetical protein